MPRLPTAEDLGVPSGYNSGRQIASYDVTALARGAAQLGEGIQRAGASLTSVGASFAAKEKSEHETLDSARADAAWVTDKIKLNSEIKDASDADALKEQPAKFQASLDRAASFIPEGPQRELWMTRRRAELEQANVNVKDQAFKLARDTNLANDQETLRILQEQAPTAAPEDRERIANIAASVFQGWKDEGYVDETKIAAYRHDWSKGYAVKVIEALPPEKRIEALTPVQTGERSKAAYQYFVSKGWSPVAAAGIVGGLIHESGGPGLKTTARAAGDGSDGSDSIGIAQWNSGRAQALKAFAASQGKDWHDFGVQLAFVDKELNGPEGAAAAKLKAATTPREAAAAFVAYERPQNFEKGATAAHGWGNRLRQAEGVFASYGGGKLGPAEGEQYARFIPADQRQQIADRAERELDTQFRQQQVARATDRAQVSSLIKDDQASITTTGTPVADLTKERVSEALGPQAAIAFEQNRSQAAQYHHQTKDWDQIPAEEIKGRLEGLKPAPGSPGFDNASKYYDAAAKQADAVVKERRTDPAAAADRMLGVAGDKGGASLDNPASYQQLYKARQVAYDQLNIPQDVRVPMTRQEAQQTWRPLDLAIQSGDAREIKDTLQATIKQLQEAFGDDADTALQQVLKEGHADRSTREMTAIILKKLAQNQMPTQEDARNLDQAQATATMERAVAGFDPRLGIESLDANGQPVYRQPAPAQTFPTPDAEAIKMLRNTPPEKLAKTIQQFNRNDAYGPGAAEKILAITGSGQAK